MRKFIAAFMGLAAVLGFEIGVGSGPAVAEPMTIRLAFTTAAVNSPHASQAQGFKDALEKLAPGRFNVELFPAGALGGERDLVESVQLGSLDMAITGTAVLSNFVPDFAVFDIPFLFRDYPHARAVLDGPVGQAALDKMKDKGLLGLAYGEVGFRDVLQNERPIKTVDDMNGIKLRTMESRIHLEAFSELGANPISMSWTEIPTALQQGMIDGLEAPLSVIASSKFWETVKYVSITNHVFTPTVHFISPVLYDKLSEEDRQAMREAAAAGRDANRAYTDKSEQEAMAELKSHGMEVDTLSSKELAKFRSKLDPLFAKLSEQFGEQMKQIEQQ